ncbi:MFS transporter [Methylobacterium haplocladii]|uniref:MFS transporter n=1 Tax=Methylobacterium haplocladii TaxID=1176176 RepID=A0A512IPS3_9HYPH|nr:MFS transporter [Methylobacterium haplocladii]GJD83332.1 putative L-galactonate transporter [Methylobacterium haplocladii]GLS58207.1 MFS transporter [Methylobacterium haplocladii]
MSWASAGRTGWPLVALLAATQLMASSDRFLLTLVATPVKAALALSDTQLGLLQGAAFALPFALASPLFGYLVDRGQRRSLLLLGIVLSSLATLGFGLAGGFLGLLVSRSALGLGQACILPAALSLLAIRLERGQLGRGVSFITAGSSLGRSVALLAGGAVLAWLTVSGGISVPGLEPLAPWQMLFVVAIAPNLVLTGLILRIRETPARAKPVPRMKALGWVLRRWRAYLPHAAAATASVLMIQTLAAWAPTFYVRAFGFTPAESGLTLGLIALLAAPCGHLAGGALLDRMRRTGDAAAAPRLLALALALTVPATVTTSLSPDLHVSLAGYAALALLFGFASPLGLGGIQFLTPPSLRGGVNALFLAAVTLVATGTGPLIVGMLNDAVFGLGGVGLALLAVFSVTAVLGGGAAILAVRNWTPSVRQA